MLDRFAALDTATVSDALEGCGLPPGQGGLRPMWGRPKLVGFAATVELESAAAESAASTSSRVRLPGPAPTMSWLWQTQAALTCRRGADS